ncbi:MAG: hypothetical protein APR54_01105 [Candidatus Cloacimonas sp. SDB]|nr:MAG: hypothetical protein APR54_01105 [Candidatus Cloacimonas sp. SDB]
MNFIPAGKTLHDLTFSLAGSKYKELVILAFGWKMLLGELLAERTSLRKLEKNILFVSVKNNIWMQELVLRKSEIIKDVKRKYNIQLKNIIFSLDWANNEK